MGSLSRKQYLCGLRRNKTVSHALILLTTLALLSCTAILGAQQLEKENALKITLFMLRNKIDLFYADFGRYPNSLEELVENKYIDAIPIDPFTQKTNTWILVPPEDNDDKGKVYDVHSKSALISENGRPYNEW